ncbi:MAG: ABC transporter permease [Candidatus Lokiarchaeota archaeon]|nr:ABC transporter permease [Candidatus Lokiarchaeota archaeon]
MSDLNLKHIGINYPAVWILTKREVIAFWRDKARIISSFAQAILFLLVFGYSLGQNTFPPGFNYKAYLASGIGALTILFTGIFGGMGLMRDKMFGFMKELIVAPVSRQTLMIGRTLGIAIQTVIQVLIILTLGIAFGFLGYNPDLFLRILIIIPIALAASMGIVGIGLIIGTKIRNFQSFGLIQTFIVMPMFWLSGTILPITNDSILYPIYQYNPFSYCVDLFRSVLIGINNFDIWLDILVMSAFAIGLILLGAISFNKMDVS